MKLLRSRRKASLLVVVTLALGLLAAACGAPQAPSSGQPAAPAPQQGGSPQPAPSAPSGGGGRSVSLAVLPVGTSTYVLGTGLASVVSQRSNVRMTVQPHSGVQAWGPLLNEGKVDLGTDAGPDLAAAFMGLPGHGFTGRFANMRYVVRGNWVDVVGAAVRKDSGIRKIRDLKGKRVTAEYPAAPLARLVLESALLVNGLSWNDVVRVPVPNIVTGMEALRDGRVDATFALVPSTPVAQETHKVAPLCGLSFQDDYAPADIDKIPPEKLKIVQDRLPGTRWAVQKPDGYIQEEAIAVRYAYYLVAGKHVPDDTIYEIVSTLWQHYQELKGFHPWLNQWTPEQMFDPDPLIPYHPGVVKFFKEKGLWTPQLDAKQQELLRSAGS